MTTGQASSLRRERTFVRSRISPRRFARSEGWRENSILNSKCGRAGRGAWIADGIGPAGRLEELSRALSSLAAFLADAPRRLEDLAAATESGLGERLYNQPPQSRIANTTIVVIAISLTVVAILCYCWCL